MIFRVTCLILIPALFANQLMLCCAHVHKGEKEAVPHVHLGWHSHGHLHSHAHHHHGHHHHVADPSHSSTPDSGQSSVGEQCADIDLESITFVDEPISLNQTKRAQLRQPANAKLLCATLTETSVSNKAPRTFEDSLSGGARYQCAIFLQNRNLRL